MPYCDKDDRADVIHKQQELMKVRSRKADFKSCPFVVGMLL